MSRMKLLIHCQTLTVAPLKFGKWISNFTPHVTGFVIHGDPFILQPALARRTSVVIPGYGYYFPHRDEFQVWVHVKYIRVAL